AGNPRGRTRVRLDALDAARQRSHVPDLHPRDAHADAAVEMTMHLSVLLQNVVHVATILLLPPLLLGVIGKTKAAFAGRVGAPYLQAYYDLLKLLKKGSVFSATTTWVFRAGPVVALSTALLAGLLIPFGSHPAP